MKSKILLILSITISVLTLNGCGGFSKKTMQSDIRKAENSSKRSLIVVNNLSDKAVKSCELFTLKGESITNQENLEGDRSSIVFYNFDSKNIYKNIDNFKIVLIDKYGFKYEKQFSIKKNDPTVIQIDTNDRMKQPMDTKRKIEKFLDGRKI